MNNAQKAHRDKVGGLWDVMGKLQFDFLKANGLMPEHSFLDIACGSFRAGRFLIDYLECGNYSVVLLMEKYSSFKKLLLYIGVSFNITLLSYFKYMDFFIENINKLFHTEYALLSLTLPLAISFFTLQQIAFLFDRYNGSVEHYSLKKYFLFVTFFPQLIAGPIVHYKELIPQFKKENFLLNYTNIALGLIIFAIGLFKKVVLADTFALYADHSFSHISTLNMLGAWIGSLSYTFQLYFDFSGYSDMAIGLALMFNILLPINFNSPYKSKNIIEFWSKWHITLTRFVNAYIYVPIVKNFKHFSFPKMMAATVISMMIIGIWHGAGWTFVLFGALHGIALVINHIFKKYKITLPTVLAWLLTFSFINASLVIFRADSIEKAYLYLTKMSAIDAMNLNYGFGTWINNFFLFIGYEQRPFIFPIVFIIIGFGIIFYKYNSFDILNKLQSQEKLTWLNFLFFIFLFGISLNFLFLSTGKEFLYFNF
jgi:D-alanyl-lipoteichoic acid acyltransferase DltB (MBOAT superfamily)